ncbi:hypothetical protein [Paractinoplanes lichenicola]|uniref:Aminoglycoside phosphotransferase n=1 Tax=Paractinoplanes lichenicola TaxID=2802976 RepID=A0ABS1VWI9_9ACTN|nr:hypothetical protein [Actinoplanes lichenicola]MBL7258859.1 hypothetical protein [Actinoplanes lichenicola]
MTDNVAWATEHLTALRLGRRLAVEVPATGPGRRAFVDITPGGVDADKQARREGWTHRSSARAFRVEHWDYDAALIDGYDYDIGATLIRSGHPADESELLTLLREWHLSPRDFTYAWSTADPR